MGSDSKKNKKLVNSIHADEHSSPGLLFWRAYFNWQRLIRVELEPHDLTQGQYSILAALAYLSSDSSVVSQQDIAKTLAMDKMMVSDIVKILLRKKFIQRKNHPDDARAFALSLSSLGKTKLQTCVPLVEQVDEKFFKSTGKHYKDFFSALLILAK